MPPRRRYKYRVEEVRESFLEENGVGPAVRDALKSLFSEPRLPDNPYFYLANLLAAYVDQSPLWKQSDADVASAVDVECAVEVVQPETKLCRHAQAANCFGLPHVLRLAPKSGVSFLSHILSHGVPEAFFPNSLPFHVGSGYTVQEFSSVQGSCCVWNPSLMHFPALEVRSDVLISGPRMDEAVRIFIDLVLACVEEVGAVPLYFVDGIAIMDPPSQLYEGDKEPFYQFYHMDDILVRPEAFEKLAIRQVLGHKCIKMSCVLMIEVPEAGQASQGKEDEHSGQLRYELATKSYFFHYASLEPSTIEYDQMQHYGTMPYEALFEGYFLTLSTACQYMQMFLEVDKQPYGPVALPANLDSLKRQIERTLYAGKSLDAFRQLLHLVMLQDATVTLVPTLTSKHIRNLEQTILTGRVRPGPQFGGTGVLASPTVLAVIPNLLRTLASSAATIQGISREVEAISSAGEKWPQKVKQLKEAGAVNDQRRVPIAQSQMSVDSRRTPRTPEVDRSMLSWLDTFDMEGKLLLQLVSIKMGVHNSMGKGVFSGLSLLIDQLLSHIPNEAPSIGTAKLLKQLQMVLVQLVQLLHVGSLTIAHSFLGRCADIVWGLNCVGVQVTSIADVQEASGEAALRGVGQLDGAPGNALTPGWVLDVQSVAGAQVQNGGLAERVCVEGAMLQYAVDVRLDEALSMLWHQVSQPPQPLNPFPKLMHIVRSRAAKMELWLDEEEAALLRMANELTLSATGDGGATGWMYAGHKAVDDNQAQSIGSSVEAGHTRAPHDDDVAGSSCVYGCYTAVALTDARVLHAMRATLDANLLKGRHWQQGAYTCEVVPALCGDAVFTNAMELHELLKPPQSQQFGDPGTSTSTVGDAHHPRLFALQSEEHHLVTGPKRKEAALAFGKEVAKQIMVLHTQSPHLLLSLELWVPAPLAAQMVDEGLATMAAATRSAAAAGSRDDDGIYVDGHLGLANSNAAVASTGMAVRSVHQSGIDLGGLLAEAPGSAKYSIEGEKGNTLVWVRIGIRALQSDVGKSRVAEALGAAARAVTQGRVLGTVILYAAPAHPDASYVPFRQHITFQHHHNSPAMRPNQAMTHAGRARSRPSTAISKGSGGIYWDRDIYQRVFLSEGHAITWASWNRDKGDPAQPFHQEHLIEEGARDVGTLMARGHVLEAHKVALICAVAAQDGSGIYQLSRCCLSTAQELTILLAMNRALVELMGDGKQDPLVRAKFDTERLRRLVILYCNRMRQAMSSPRSCYFTGLVSLVPAMLAELADTALSEFTFYASQLAALDQLAVWTKACEVSVALALHDCIDDDVAQKWLGRPKGNSSGSSSSSARKSRVPPMDSGNPRDFNTGGSVVLRSGSTVKRGPLSGPGLPAHPAVLQAQKRHTSASGGVVRKRSLGGRDRPSVSGGSATAGAGAIHTAEAGFADAHHAPREGRQEKWRGGVVGAVRLGGDGLSPEDQYKWAEDD